MLNVVASSTRTPRNKRNESKERIKSNWGVEIHDVILRTCPTSSELDAMRKISMKLTQEVARKGHFGRMNFKLPMRFRWPRTPFLQPTTTLLQIIYLHVPLLFAVYWIFSPFFKHCKLPVLFVLSLRCLFVAPFATMASRKFFLLFHWYGCPNNARIYEFESPGRYTANL